MKKIFHLIALCAVSALFVACSEKTEQVPQPELSLSTAFSGAVVSQDGLKVNAIVSSDGESVEIAVSSNVDWTVTSGTGQWCALEVSGSSLTLTADSNPGGIGRIANFNVIASNVAGTVSANIVVLQDIVTANTDVPITFTFQGDDTGAVLPAEGGSYSVGVTCSEAWTVATETGWLSAVQDDNGFVLYAEENNTIGVRTGSVRVSTGDGTNYVTLSVDQLTTDSAAMIIEVTVGEDTENRYMIPISSSNPNCLIDWGDGSMTKCAQSFPSHTYDAPGVYDITIWGTIGFFNYNSVQTYAPCLTAVKQWGHVGLTRLNTAFLNCVNLKTVAAPEPGTFANFTGAVQCFDGCTSLESVPDGFFANTAMTSVNAAFRNCTSLTELPADLFTGSNDITNFGNTFSGCNSLTGESPFSEIGETKYHLYERNSLSGIFATVTTMAGCFAGCSGLSDYTAIESSYPDWL